MFFEKRIIGSRGSRRPRPAPASLNPRDPITIALAEDVGSGDLTCQFFVEREQRGWARIIAREEGIVAGLDTAAEIFQRVDTETNVQILKTNGGKIGPPDTVLEIEGRVRSILTSERVALNFLQRLSGVATLTRKFVEAVAGTNARILDTRKTTPGLRALEKAAVRAGGGMNHRFGLFDMVMVKDNHLAAKEDRGFLQRAITRLRAERPEIRVEMEADTLAQVRLFLEIGGVDVILLDNMSLADLREAVALSRGRVQLEASGGVTLETVRAIAKTGVDFISVGALTHSARALDFSLELQ